MSFAAQMLIFFIPPVFLIISSQAGYWLSNGAKILRGRCRRARRVSPSGKAKAQEISEILRKDWDNWKSLFNANNKNLLNDSWEYWIQNGHDYWVVQYRDVITLQNGSINDYDVHWKEPRKSVLFYIESGLKE